MTSRGFAEAKPVEGLDVERTLLNFQKPFPLGDRRKKAPDSRQRPSVLLAYYSMRAEGAPGVVGTGFPTATPFGRLGNDSRVQSPVKRLRYAMNGMTRSCTNWRLPARTTAKSRPWFTWTSMSVT